MREEVGGRIEKGGHILTPVPTRLAVRGFDRHVVILRCCRVGSGRGASSRLMFEFGCSPELRPGMHRREDKGAVNQKTAKLQINSREVSSFIARSQRNFPALEKRLNGM